MNKIVIFLSLILLSSLITYPEIRSEDLVNIDLNSFQIEKDVLKDQDVWQNFLILKGIPERIKLARSTKRSGFDPKSIRMQWLKENELLWISWTTKSRGSGGYNYEGNIILGIYNNEIKELFRDSFNSFSRGGWSYLQEGHIDFEYLKDRREVILKKSKYVREGGDKPFPMSREEKGDSSIFYIKVTESISIWKYRIEDENM